MLLVTDKANRTLEMQASLGLLSSYDTLEVAWNDIAKTLEVVESGKVDLVTYTYWHLRSFVDNAVTVQGHSMLDELVHDVFLSHGLDCMKYEVLAVIPVVHWLVEIHKWV